MDDRIRITIEVERDGKLTWQGNVPAIEVVKWLEIVKFLALQGSEVGQSERI